MPFLGGFILTLKHILRKSMYAAAIIGAVSFATPSDAQAATYTEQEGNDTFQTAQPIPVNNVIVGEIGKNDSVDFYKVQAPANGRLNFELPNISGKVWEVIIYNEDGKVLERRRTDGSSTALGNTAATVGVAAGTYYVGVQSYSRASGIPYTGTLTFTQTNDYERELNDTYATATPIAVNREISGVINADDSHDYYTFTTNEAGLVSVSTANISGKRLDIDILDRDGKRMNSLRTDRSSTAADRSSLQIGLPAGTYYIDVKNYDNMLFEEYSFILDYTAGTHYEQEYNNSIQQANPIALNKTYTGNIPWDDSYDYYAFTLQKDLQTTIQFLNTPGKRWTITLYDANGKKIKDVRTASDSTASEFTTLQQLLAKGTYYVGIDNYDSTGQLSYNFSVNVPSTTNFKDVPSSHPYFNEINDVRSMGIITGYEDGTFRPNNNISRQHIAAMITRSNAKLELVRYGTSFADVTMKNAYYDAIQTLYRARIIDGSEKGYSRYFEPNANITRAQLSKILVNAYKLEGSTSTKHYTDLTSADWYTPYANVLAANGIVLDNTKKFNGKKFVTRGELAYMIKKASDASK